MRPKRCDRCNKMIATRNKSGFCSYCYMIHYKKAERGKKKNDKL